MAHLTSPCDSPTTARASLRRFHELAPWMQAYPRIQSGYRNQVDTVWSCIRSIFSIHNEFVNIWSHLAPALIHLILLTREIWAVPSSTVLQDSESAFLMVKLYTWSAVICLFCSSAYHIMNAHSHRVAQRLLQLDYLGIVINAVTTCIAFAWCGFTGKPDLQMLYLTAYTGLAMMVFWMLLMPEADGTAAAVRRSASIATIAASGWVPILHAYLQSGTPGLQYFPIKATFKMDICYFFGSIIYVLGFPESWFPQTFDIWGASHQIFHISVMIGQIMFLRGLRAIVSEIGKS